MSPSHPASATWLLRSALALGCGALGATAARAQETQLDVGVRTAVVDRPLSKSDLRAAKPHGKIYGIVSVQHVTGESKLIKPVNEGAIMEALSQELNAHGFSLFQPGQNPEILLTVYYGRGFVHNPYLTGGGRTETPAGASPVGSGGSNGSLGPAPSLSVTGVPTSFFKALQPGYEAKTQKARYEKLYIRVSAWQYPTDPKARVKQLWNATMVVDDPDHRDLNAVAAKMLEAGAPYFDKEIAEEEVDVYKPLPEGHVQVGTPEVVGAQVK